MIEDITSHVKESTEMRNEGKKENEIFLKDSEDAQAAITKAIAVLETHYKNRGAIEKEEWEFVQTKKAKKGVDLPEEPETWGSSYTGTSDPNAQPGGIITVLKETSADFAEMEADTKAQETTDQKAYDEDMKSCAIEKAKRTQESKMKSEEKKRLT